VLKVTYRLLRDNANRKVGGGGPCGKIQGHDKAYCKEGFYTSTLSMRRGVDAQKFRSEYFIANGYASAISLRVFQEQNSNFVTMTHRVLRHLEIDKLRICLR
jgi:hypothetical protein